MSQLDTADVLEEEIYTAQTVFEDLQVLWTEVVIKEITGNKHKKVIKFNSTSLSESNLLLGVFFGKYKCAVVSTAVYEIVCELNPQVKNSTIILASSPPLINTFFARSKKISENTVSILEVFASDLKDDAEGRQVLNLFKVDRIEKLSLDDLRETKELINKYKSLKKIK